MPVTAPAHACRVLATPWPGVIATRIDSARHYGRHWHATFGIGFVERGAHRSASGRGSVDAFAGDLVATNPGEVHDGRPLGAPSRRWCTVFLEPEVFASWSGRGAEQAIVRPVLRDDRLRAALQSLVQRLDAWQPRPAPADALACDESLAVVMQHLLDRHTTARPLDDATADAARIARVQERLADLSLPTPSLAELAALAGLGRFQLLRRFRSACGLPPHAWLLQQRAERARALIARGTPIAEAAAQAGFADQSHLTRVFARSFGYTPGALKPPVRRRAQ